MPTQSRLSSAPYVLTDLSSALPLGALRRHYDTLPQDPYVPQGFRYKQIVRCRAQGGALREQPHGPLYQGSDINPTHGGLTRSYERFGRLDLVAAAVRSFVELCGIDEHHEILVQPHRITCRPGRPGEPAVEGFHRDGIHYLAILCVSRESVLGGETQLSRDGGRTLDLRRTLSPGEMLVLDDRRWLHYTTPVALAGGAAGHRDVLLLSANPGQVNRAPRPRRAQPLGAAAAL